MANTSHWVLFGYDLRGMWQGYARAWHEVVMGYGSNLRLALDEPVAVNRIENGDAFVHGAGDKDPRARAILLPESEILVRHLTLPRISESRLDAIVASEVMASSPFPAEDTACGWHIIERSDSVLHLALVLISKSAAMDYLHRHDPDLPVEETELWAEVDHHYVVVEGFGENERNRRYRTRLKRFAALIAIAVVCVLVMAAIPGLYKSYELETMESWYAEVNQEAREVVAVRSALAKQNEYLSQLNTEVTSITSPVLALDLLTHLLGDEVWINHYVQKGRVVELDGNAVNAAELMQQLSDSNLFEDVEARSGFRQLGRSGLERFQLELTFMPGPIE